MGNSRYIAAARWLKLFVKRKEHAEEQEEAQLWNGHVFAHKAEVEKVNARPSMLLKKR
jgi:hypothetical protein